MLRVNLKKITFFSIFICYPYFVKATDYYSMPGENLSKITNPQNGDRLIVHSTSRKSHCCSIWEISLPNDVSLGNITASGSLVPIVSKNRGADYPFITFLGNDEGLNRKCFYHEDDNPASSLKAFEISIQKNFNFPLLGAYYKCEETTLYGSFNTSVTDFNFVEITNSLPSTSSTTGLVSGKILVKDSITNNIIADRAFTVSSGRRLDVDIHSISGPGKFGTITIYHDGPPGALSATTSQYKIRTLNPLDFEPVSQTEFTTHGIN